MSHSLWRSIRRHMHAKGFLRRLLFTLTSIFILCMLFTLETSAPSLPYVRYFSPPITTSVTTSKAVKKILLWMPFLSKDILESERRCLSTCPVKCEVTVNKDEIEEADAVNFHLSDLWTKFWSIGTKEVIKFPSYRRADQVWLLSNMEPPPHLWGDLNVFNNRFNWTVWYRRDATVIWPYGMSMKLNNTEHKKALQEHSTRNIYKEKQFEIIGRISNCRDPGRRYRIIRDLQKFLPIDMYGLCYNKPCGNNPRDQADKSCDTFMRKYKFYLAFENAACKDYITEKYWWALDRDQIPIVNWKGIDNSLPIPHSYINIYDFPDLESFAEYIKLVSNNETLYNSYFDWKLGYKNERTCVQCAVCHALHERSVQPQVVSNLDAWVRDDVCSKVGIYNNAMKALSSWAFWYLGI